MDSPTYLLSLGVCDWGCESKSGCWLLLLLFVPFERGTYLDASDVGWWCFCVCVFVAGGCLLLLVSFCLFLFLFPLVIASFALEKDMLEQHTLRGD